MCFFNFLGSPNPHETSAYHNPPWWWPFWHGSNESRPNFTPVNAVYYPNWRVYRGESPATLNYAYISHVFYAFLHVNVDGTVILSDNHADTQIPVDCTNGCLESFRRLKIQHTHLKLIFSIGGGGASQNFASVASSPLSRQNFARSAKILVDTYGFDGIDIDWETPSNSEEGKYFIELLAAVRLYLPCQSFLLTTALPAGQWALQHIDLYKASQFVDFINLMAYDFTGPWTQKSGHHAQLYAGGPHDNCGASAVDYIISTGFPAAKILFGVAVYGRSFLGATGPDQSFSRHGGDEGTFDYKDLPRPCCEEVVNTRLVAASCVSEDGGFITYDSPLTTRIKGNYCRGKGLAASHQFS